MKDTQIEKLSLKELVDLKGRLESAIGRRRDMDRSELKEKLAVMAQDAGFSITELFTARGRGAAKSKSSSAAKFQHPDDPSLTWSGRGRKPKWLQGASDVERFRIR